MTLLDLNLVMSSLQKGALDDLGITNALDDLDVLFGSSGDGELKEIENVFVAQYFPVVKQHIIAYCSKELEPGVTELQKIKEMTDHFENVLIQKGREKSKYSVMNAARTHTLKIRRASKTGEAGNDSYNVVSYESPEYDIEWYFKLLEGGGLEVKGGVKKIGDKKQPTAPEYVPPKNAEAPVTAEEQKPAKPEPASPAGEEPEARQEEASTSPPGPEQQMEPKSPVTAPVTPVNEVTSPNDIKQNKPPVIEVDWNEKNKHKWNTTGAVFKRSDGKPLTQSDVIKHIKEEKKKGNQKYIDAFPDQLIDDPNRKKVSYTIDGQPPRHYGYVFDPNWNKKEKEKDKEPGYTGAVVNQPGIVTAPAGIRLHTKPDPFDSDYQNRKGASSVIYPQESPLVIVATGDSAHLGWVKVKMPDGQEGWIENRFVMPRKPGTNLYYVKKGDNIESIINSSPVYKDFAYSTGNDRRSIAAAILVKNNGNPGVYLDEKKKGDHSFKDFMDPTFAKNRNVYEMIGVREGYYIELPTPEEIKKYQDTGQVGTRTELENWIVGSSKGMLGFVEGVGIGFAEAAWDMVTGIWDLVSGIFTGELFTQAWDMIKQLWDAGWEGVWSMIKEMWNGTVQSFKDAWNNPNPEEKWKFFGKIVGMILFEVLLTILTLGAGAAASIAAKFPKVMKVVKMVEKAIPDIPPAVKNKMDEVKKLKNFLTQKVDNIFKKKPSYSKNLDNTVDGNTKEKLEAKAVEDIDPTIKKDSNEYMEKVAALAAAKIITEGADKIDLSVFALELELAFLKSIAKVRFDHEAKGNGVYRILMIGTKSKIKESYTTNQPTGKVSGKAQKHMDDLLAPVKSSGAYDTAYRSRLESLKRVLENFEVQKFKIGSHDMLLDEEAVTHMLGRHSKKYRISLESTLQSYFPDNFEITDIVNIFRRIEVSAMKDPKIIEAVNKFKGGWGHLYIKLDGTYYQIGFKNHKPFQFFNPEKGSPAYLNTVKNAITIP
jgi:hypothetical protein